VSYFSSPPFLSLAFERRHQVLMMDGFSAEDKSNRYVAEDNIQLTNDEVPSEALMKLAGRYFRRFDREEGVFVSNIRKEYPDD
jgi:hypothetical protein